MNRIVATAFVISLSIAATGCAKKKPADLPPPPQTNIGQSDDRDRAAGTVAPGSQADFVQRMAGQDTIFFDTDRYNIDNVDAAALQAQAQWLAQYPGKRVRIEGHADERGTREYNLALGERRANAAKNYLVSLGIDASRLTVVSYGKERPMALGSDENAWARNRRAVTVTID
ncbi:peptidoglycan-associated lipoprotein Pal [Erythrobacter colymbi]|jgi:peptidoglycan-associated lipoprotein|uniref:peptidoglycan-associated lipoprotein Pal n=1 Tax=Erythrobacter colymbi TaxID=1161202 RepID=UPI000A3D45BB|nr:peptidoglycan-associated lipoprotein Pal [Erythrobacter colymbi]